MSTPDPEGRAESDGVDAGVERPVAPAHGDTVETVSPDASRPKSDWDRYGMEAASRPSRSPRSDTTLRRRASGSESRDDMYLDYRRENATRSRRGGGHSSRFVANAAAASIVGIAAVALLVAGMLSAGPAPTPTPSRTAPTATPEPTPAPTTGVVGQTGHVTVLIDLPVSVYVPDRAQSPTLDGSVMFLAGQGGGIAVDPLTGAVGTVFGGEAFTSVRRTIAAAGSLWISSWPNSYKQCGPMCWDQAVTYRLNVGTGKIQKTYPATYLVGLADGGLWLASKGKLERLDARAGASTLTTPWPIAAEPRVGCAGLWSVDIQTSDVILTGIDMATGEALALTTILPLEATYGPILVGPSCWMMSGFDGVSASPTSVYLINGDQSQLVSRRYSEKVLVLDGEFWTYSPGGVIQRLEANAGTPYGPSYKLDVPPSSDDAGMLFASGERLWMLQGQKLASFDVPLGMGNSGG